MRTSTVPQATPMTPPSHPSSHMRRDRLARANHGQCRPGAPWVFMLLYLALTNRASQIAAADAFNSSACEDYMSANDVNSDNVLNRAEYINLLLDLSPYPNCPNITDISSFLGKSIFGTAYDRLACLCEDYAKSAFDPYCCTGIRTPGYYPDSYTNTVCRVLNNVMVLQCDSENATPTPSPSVSPPTSSAPSINNNTESPTATPSTAQPTTSPSTTKPPIHSPSVNPTRARTSAPSTATVFPTLSPISSAAIAPTVAPQQDISVRPPDSSSVTPAPSTATDSDSSSSPDGSRGNGVVVVPPDNGNADDDNKAIAVAVPVGMAFILATVLIFAFLQRRRQPPHSGRAMPSSSMMSASAKSAVINDAPSYAPLDDTDNISDDLEAGNNNNNNKGFSTSAASSSSAALSEQKLVPVSETAQFIVPSALQGRSSSTRRMETLLNELTLSEAEVAAGGSGGSASGDQGIEAVTLGTGRHPTWSSSTSTSSSSAERAETSSSSGNSSSSQSPSVPSSTSSLVVDGDSSSDSSDDSDGTSSSDEDGEEDSTATDLSHGFASSTSSIALFDDTASDSSSSIVLLNTSKSRAHDLSHGSGNNSISSISSARSLPPSVLSASQVLSQKSKSDDEDNSNNEPTDVTVMATSPSILPKLRVRGSPASDNSESDSGWESGGCTDSDDDIGEDVLSTSPERKNSPNRNSPPRSSPDRDGPSSAGMDITGPPAPPDNSDPQPEVSQRPEPKPPSPTNDDNNSSNAQKSDDGWKMIQSLGNIFGR